MCDFMAYVAFNKVTYKTWKGEKNFAECYCWRLQFKSSLPRRLSLEKMFIYVCPFVAMYAENSRY